MGITIFRGLKEKFSMKIMDNGLERNKLLFKNYIKLIKLILRKDDYKLYKKV